MNNIFQVSKLIKSSSFLVEKDWDYNLVIKPEVYENKLTDEQIITIHQINAYAENCFLTDEQVKIEYKIPCTNTEKISKFFVEFVTGKNIKCVEITILDDTGSDQFQLKYLLKNKKPKWSMELTQNNDKLLKLFVTYDIQTLSIL